jgi:hypothetical protein
MSSYTRPMYAKSREQLTAFMPIFTQLVYNARAHFGKLNVVAASQLIEDIEGVSTFDLLEKIKHHYGRPGVNKFKEYFGKSKKEFDKKRIMKLQDNLNKGLITYKQFSEKKMRCFKWTWTLLPEKMFAPGEQV